MRDVLCVYVYMCTCARFRQNRVHACVCDVHACVCNVSKYWMCMRVCDVRDVLCVYVRVFIYMCTCARFCQNRVSIGCACVFVMCDVVCMCTCTRFRQKMVYVY